MASITKQIQDALLADPDLAAAHNGRVYRRPLKPRGNRATPEAFDADGRLHPVSLVISDQGDITDLRFVDRASGQLTIWIHGPDTTAAELLITETVVPAIIRVVMDPDAGFEDQGRGIQLEPADRFGLREDPGFLDAIVEYVRFSAAKLWR